jgi:hypothetical protein
MVSPSLVRRPLLGLLTSIVVLLAAASAGAQEGAPSKPDAEASSPASSSETTKKEALPDEEAASDAEIRAQEAESQALGRDLSPTLKPIYELGGEGRGRIKMTAWVDSKNLTYHIGDILAIYVRPKTDAYLTILNVGSSGKVTLLYPNHFQRDAKVKGGTTVRIPPRKGKWNISVDEPAGVDLIKIIASRKPLTLKELQEVASADEKNPVITLGRSAEETARDLTPQLKPEAEDEEHPNFGVLNILVRVKRG